jgi:hypothetical protein
MRSGAIRASLWVSGDDLACRNCGRAPNWLDIVTSAATSVHSATMIAKVILGDIKYVNVEVPHAIAGVRCVSCGTSISGLRSFKCHNWAYAFGDLEREVERVRQGSREASISSGHPRRAPTGPTRAMAAIYAFHQLSLTADDPFLLRPSESCISCEGES